MQFSYSSSSSTEKVKMENNKKGFFISDYFNFNESEKKRQNFKKNEKKKKNPIEIGNEKKGIEILKKSLEKKEKLEKLKQPPNQNLLIEKRKLNDKRVKSAVMRKYKTNRNIKYYNPKQQKYYNFDDYLEDHDPTRKRKFHNKDIKKQITSFNEWEKKRNEKIKQMRHEKMEKIKKLYEKPKPRFKRDKNEPIIFERLYKNDIKSRCEINDILDKINANEFKIKKPVYYFQNIKTKRITRTNINMALPEKNKVLNFDDDLCIFSTYTEPSNHEIEKDVEEIQDQLRSRLFKKVRQKKRENISVDVRDVNV